VAAQSGQTTPHTMTRPHLDADTRDALVSHERVQWAGIRDAALGAFGRDEVYAYHDGRTTHRCRTLDELARATRTERKRLGLRWPEDR